jgi:hypothetical protein
VRAGREERCRTKRPSGKNEKQYEARTFRFRTPVIRALFADVSGP